MGTVALTLVLASALAHASWNLLVKDARGGLPFAWMCTLSAALWFLPLAAVEAVRVGIREPIALLATAGASGALHCMYFLTLQRGYRLGALSVVYPVARSTGAVLAAAAAIVALGERPDALPLVGIALVAVGLVGFTQRAGFKERRSLGLAVATGCLIACYTVWDKAAVDAEYASPIVFWWLLNLFSAGLMTISVRRRRREVREGWLDLRRHVVLFGLLSPLAYVLTLFALSLAPASYVAPAREISIAFAAVLGRVMLGERLGRARVVATLAVVTGVVMLGAE